MRSTQTLCFGALALQLLVFGCDDEEDSGGKLPWSKQRTQVLNAERNVVEVKPAEGTACIDYQNQCLKPQEKCGKNGADIVVDTDGRLLDYICYPGEATLSVEEIEARQGSIAQNESDTVILLDSTDDGVDIQGDLSIGANNVVVYGEEANRAVISGNVTIDGNNALVRGVRIEGAVSIVKNNVVLALCVIEGNLVIQGNNAELIGCDVLGNVTVTGNNAKLYGNRIGGTISIAGMGSSCVDNFSVSDANGNQVVEVGELGAPRACS